MSIGALAASEEVASAIPFLPENSEPLFVQEREPEIPLVSPDSLQKEECCIPCCNPCGPWFTGPLLTLSSTLLPPGFIGIEMYMRFNVKTGIYDRHWYARETPNFYTIGPLMLIQLGLADWIQLQMISLASYNKTRGESSYVFNDLSANVSFQLHKGKGHNVKFYIQELFPTGRYQHLRMHKLGTDIGGGGCFVTQLGLIFGKIHENCGSYFSWRFNPFYNFRSSRPVRGINAYGGAHNTKGKIHLGASFGAFLGMEYTLTQNWVLASDVYGIYQDKISFSGKAGIQVNGTKASVGLHSSVQFGLAPAIEYNWSESIGIVFGPWFTIAGRNTSRFINGLIALNYYGKIPKRAPKYYYWIECEKDCK